jgi:transforming growth factor-beta-induced protein
VASERADVIGQRAQAEVLGVLDPRDVFDKVPKKSLNALLENRRLLRRVLLYHVVAGKVPAKQVVKRKRAKTLTGARVAFKVRGKRVYVSDARVIAPDIRASNGIVYAVNRVLTPPSLR